MTLLWTLVLLFNLSPGEKPKAVQRQDDRIQQEERKDYYKKWLEEDVKYIISEEEKAVFQKLTTAEEKENFIEQFWARRDTNPRTEANEFKAEHYRRIAYANERFQSGKPGWMTDRGRIYIIHGEPAYIERHPSGGSYTRKFYEGGGQSFAYPFEVWHYMWIEAVDDAMDLEFVDPSFSGEYRLALRAEEKDMLLYVPGTAPTFRELVGKDTGRKDRPFFNPRVESNPHDASLHGYRSKDAPFARYARYANAQRPPKIKFARLKQIVTTQIGYQDLSAHLRSDMILLNPAQVLVPITVEVENKELNFRLINGAYRADANIYGVVRTMLGKIVAEFEDTVVAEYKPELLEYGRGVKSVYQKSLVLETGRQYRVDVVVRDKDSNRTALLQSGLRTPKKGDEEHLRTSSLILSRFVEAASDQALLQDRFVLGDLRIIPNATNLFYGHDTLHAYIQVYNVELDQSSLLPQVQVRYTVRRGKEVVLEFQDNTGHSIEYYSPRRLVLLHDFDLKNLKSGSYQLNIEVKDLIGKDTVAVRGAFRVTDQVSD
ncbi:MAG: GWxTD domain-containing protein [Acidobacteriota bacterium]